MAHDSGPTLTQAKAVPKIESVSVIICTYESRSRLEITLPTWDNLLMVREVVIVDANSSDSTAEFVFEVQTRSRAAVKLVNAPLQGLANARNIGSKTATSEFLLHAGPDNIMPPETLIEMLRLLQTYSLVSCSTRLIEPVRYFDRAHDLSKRRLLTGPILTAVGTPYIASRNLFADFPFNEAMKHADDTELCGRLVSRGHRIYRTQFPCHEVGFTSLKDLRERWSRWGASDSQFHNEKKANWSAARRLKSLNRAFIAEVVEPARALSLSQYLYGLPFFLTAWLFRAFGRIRELMVRRALPRRNRMRSRDLGQSL